MQRYFIDQKIPDNGELIISGDDARHIAKVMRGEPGDRIVVVADGTAYEAELGTVSQEVGVRILKKLDGNPELPLHVAIACGLPKGDKLDLIAQKGTELGMHRLIPFEAERSVVKWDAAKAGKKAERLRKIVKEAAEQSHRTVIPHVHTPESFPELLKSASRYGAVIAAYEDEARKTDRTRFADTLKSVYDKGSILLVFGPEGGFSQAEITGLERAGALFTSLGPRILRAETAPLYALAAISYEYE
ncbi:16S rRNA (uracil(1498)-N(3))-methyltransferase [Indiicoccus explosivorum]|uniref:16S rRNA (uracil(1498)-N(3))-methyltransferase n=1 Tax=Indiicoccus explosivorum TaxID=1917864 RepID=UPI000B438140|nr:16S rRNA (uracil(1498)-N(3))-methyltransferase [Indiicoccus explosivorum]